MLLSDRNSQHNKNGIIKSQNNQNYIKNVQNNPKTPYNNPINPQPNQHLINNSKNLIPNRNISKERILSAGKAQAQPQPGRINSARAEVKDKYGNIVNIGNK